MKIKEYELLVGGKKITAVFSDLAEQAQGSVMLKCDDTVVLATACMSKDGKDNRGFFNLTVEYLEKFYASGGILGSQFMRREGRPSDKAILSSRVIDRTIRPLFPHHIKNAVQVITTVLAVGKSDPTILAVNAASLSIAVSPIPWGGPVGAVHVGRNFNETELSTNLYTTPSGEPSYAVDLTVCGRDRTINMIEAMTFEISEDEFAKALALAEEEITALEAWQKKIVEEIGKEKLDMPEPKIPDAVKELFEAEIAPKLPSIFGSESKSNIHALEDSWKNLVEEKFKEDELSRAVAGDYFEEKINDVVHEAALARDERVDGRALDQVRALEAHAGGISPSLHGSGIFYRGETHVLSVLTLGGPDDAHALDGMEVKGKKRFMHHYNFPPYSVGETGRLGGINRREMGHGFLAEKALWPIMPDKLDFPYTMRVVSESLSSNGSTSQASICGSTIALLDGGVPIKAPVAGIAMGLMLAQGQNSNLKSKNYKILTDIQGPEDHHGDMDFKIAGTRNGITAVQLDIKVDGVPKEILVETLSAAKKAREEILDVIEKEIAKPRAELSPSAPRILVIRIKPDQIGLVIGGGGKTVNAIRDKTGAEITIEDDGTVYVTGKSPGAEQALEMIKDLTREIVVGESFEGEVVKILEIGAVVKITGAADGLVHISEIAPFRVARVTDFLKEGMKVPVKVVAVDPERGRISLSIKAAKPDLFKPKA